MLLLQMQHFLSRFQNLEWRFCVGLRGHALFERVRRLRDAGAPTHLDPVGLFTVVAASGIERRVIELRCFVEPGLRSLARVAIGVDVTRVCRTKNS